MSGVTITLQRRLTPLNSENYILLKNIFNSKMCIIVCTITLTIVIKLGNWYGVWYLFLKINNLRGHCRAGCNEVVHADFFTLWAGD